ncbi:hypothetical protein LTR36_003909 [Oleoguttula mirabilis]|uniref:Uncharacterized protein n=1 Tax=Oleoguttula mirabilis TaxID=1507867 RepID=A0AAV9JI16_9PEZI|nr:hypothetical protein LTR36_003909 [Oleoguttula mirabilis]
MGSFPVSTAPPLTPKKRNKFHAMWLRHLDKQDAKKRGTDQEQKARSLIFAAHCLHDEIEQQTIDAHALLKRAEATPRPATPPERDPLFQRPKDAPMSDYERLCRKYNDVVAHYEALRQTFRQLQERVASFQGQVAGLKGEVVPAKRMGKVEHDVESLDNAGRNLDVEVLELVGLVGQVREAAM